MDTKGIIERNTKRLYRIPRKYKYLTKLFQGEIRSLYFGVMQHIKDQDLYRVNGKECFHLTTSEIVKIRGKGSQNTANRYINFLCAMGLIRKLSQIKYQNLTKINEKFLKGKKDTILPMNTFYFYAFDPEGERLEEIEARCKDLVVQKVTKANISKDTLILNGLGSIAEELFEGTDSALRWKNDSYCKLYNFLTEKIQEKGYATKQDLYDGLTLNRGAKEFAIDKILRQYRDMIREDFRYQRPTKAMKEQYHLTSDSWIFSIKSKVF